MASAIQQMSNAAWLLRRSRNRRRLLPSSALNPVRRQPRSSSRRALGLGGLRATPRAPRGARLHHVAPRHRTLLRIAYVDSGDRVRHPRVRFEHTRKKLPERHIEGITVLRGHGIDSLRTRNMFDSPPSSAAGRQDVLRRCIPQTCALTSLSASPSDLGADGTRASSTKPSIRLAPCPYGGRQNSTCVAASSRARPMPSREPRPCRCRPGRAPCLEGTAPSARRRSSFRRRLCLAGPCDIHAGLLVVWRQSKNAAASLPITSICVMP